MCIDSYADILIHAPTRGATSLLRLLACPRQFQSTLPREERLKCLFVAAVHVNFNPRSHERSDYLLRLVDSSGVYFNPRSHERSDVFPFPLFYFLDISIHAPTRGATIHCKAKGTSDVFQSTLPREERQYRALQHMTTLSNFNPRSHERSDSAISAQSHSYGISIHAPTRGATAMPKPLTASEIISIHAPTRGATAILHKKFVYFYTIPTINI